MMKGGIVRTAGLLVIKLVPALLAVIQLVAVLWGHSSMVTSVVFERSSASVPAGLPSCATPQATGNGGGVSPPTIVCQLSGEMGNNLGKYAHCMALARWLEERQLYGLTEKATIVLRHQSLAKWAHARRDLQQCFPHFRKLDFEEGNTKDFDAKVPLLEELMGPRLRQSNTTTAGIGSGNKLTNVLTDINSPVLHQVKQTVQTYVDKRNMVCANSSATANHQGLPLPFLYSNYMVGFDGYLEEFLDDYRRIFAFDEEACCQHRAEPDETVFHLRHFLIELSIKIGTQKGFAEVGPRQAACELLGHLKSGDKVALVTRYASAHTKKVQPYVTAMEERGLQVRVITNQTGAQDFCFLRSAQKELVGIALSTYFVWAGILSECRRVLVYSLDTIERRSRGVPINFAYPFDQRPQLQSKFHFRVLQPNETQGNCVAHPPLPPPKLQQ